MSSAEEKNHWSTWSNANLTAWFAAQRLPTSSSSLTLLKTRISNAIRSSKVTGHDIWLNRDNSYMIVLSLLKIKDDLELVRVLVNLFEKLFADDPRFLIEDVPIETEFNAEEAVFKEEIKTDGFSSTVRINPRNEKDPPVYIPPYLLRHLKKHQIEGMQFMWGIVMEKSAGGILAHAMGLGKTIQSISFVHCVLLAVAEYHRKKTASEALPMGVPPDWHLPKRLQSTDSPRILVLCPPIVIRNWQVEYERWIPEDVRHSHRWHCMRVIVTGMSWQDKSRAIQGWNQHGGILVCGYHMFRNCLVHGGAISTYYERNCHGKWDKHVVVQPLEKMDKLGRTLLEAPDIVIADEGHVIKNSRGTLSSLVKRFATPLRICLTGYPLQNNLREYWCMLDFANSRALNMNEQQFNCTYSNPIEAGCMKDSKPAVRKTAARLLYQLIQQLEPCVMRFDQSKLKEASSLIQVKHEFVLQCRLSPIQMELYRLFLEARDRQYHVALFTKTVILGRIVNHPAILARYSVENIPEELKDTDNGQREQQKEWNRVSSLKDWLPEMPVELDSLQYAPKMVILFSLLLSINNKHAEGVLVFSRSIPTLDYIGKQLREVFGLPFFRMDGTTPNLQRQAMIRDFNNAVLDGVKTRIFLISLMTGALGINLTRANRVILVDVGWNPCNDEQGVARAYRLGQAKPVYVYRLHGYGTIEEKLYRLNIHKAALSKRVVDKRSIEKHFTRMEMKDYFNDPVEPPEYDGELEECEEDAVLKEVLKEHRCLLVNWFHHHSLLNETANELTEQELLQAAEELNQTRKKREEADMKADLKGLLQFFQREDDRGHPSDVRQSMGSTGVSAVIRSQLNRWRPSILRNREDRNVVDRKTKHEPVTAARTWSKQAFREPSSPTKSTGGMPVARRQYEDPMAVLPQVAPPRHRLRYYPDRPDFAPDWEDGDYSLDDQCPYDHNAELYQRRLEQMQCRRDALCAFNYNHGCDTEDEFSEDEFSEDELDGEEFGKDKGYCSEDEGQAGGGSFVVGNPTAAVPMTDDPIEDSPIIVSPRGQSLDEVASALDVALRQIPDTPLAPSALASVSWPSDGSMLYSWERASMPSSSGRGRVNLNAGTPEQPIVFSDSE